MLDEVWLKWKNQTIETINSAQIIVEPFCHFWRGRLSASADILEFVSIMGFYFVSRSLFV